MRHIGCIGDGCPHCKKYDADPVLYAPMWRAMGGRVVIDQTTTMHSPKDGLCKHLGRPTGEKVTCPTCTGKVELKLFECAVYGKCTVGKQVAGVACCNSPCKMYKPQEALPMPTPPVPPRRAPKWAYGVTTVPERKSNRMLEDTLLSLREGGFDEPWLFVDGDRDSLDWGRVGGDRGRTFHHTPVKTFGNWVLSLWELYLRNPAAERFALFQDDIVVMRNLRAYLDRVPYPERGYLNLYTFPQNEALRPQHHTGFYSSNQMGRGAVALVFDKEALKTVLSARHMVDRVESIVRGHRSVDGGVVTAMKQAGFKEYVHYPSLVQHQGLQSTMGNPPHPQSKSFLGESVDAMTLLEQGVTV